MPLSNNHIDFITRDLESRGIVSDEFHDEVIDHVCAAVEERMARGERFADAYEVVIQAFGQSNGLLKTQRQIIQVENKTVRLMLRNYLNIAFRHLSKQRFYSLVNIFGLAAGVAACLIIVLYVRNELSYDRFNTKADRIYRIAGEIKFGGNHWQLAVCPAPMAEALERDYAEVELAGRFRDNGSFLVKRNIENYKEDRVVYADNNILRIFTFDFLEGNPDQALTGPNEVVISKRLADKYFPNDNPVGKSLILDNNLNVNVTGVYKDLPQASHFHFDMLISMPTLEESKNGDWVSNNFQTYVLLSKGADASAFSAKLPELVTKYIGPQAAQILGNKNFDLHKFEADGNLINYWAQPLLDIHLKSHQTTGEFEPNGNIMYVYLFGAIAFFILVIACINFMNLSTARSANRAMEVGVRKVLGSLRGHLVRQFLTESIVISFAAFVLAIGLAYILLPLFNNVALMHLHIPFTQPLFYVALLLASLVVGTMAGLYPSFFLSSFRPINVLKGKLSRGMKSGIVRSALVVFQFTISIFLIVGTLVVYRQLHFIQTTTLGFNKDQVIILHDAYALGNGVEAFKNEVVQSPAIISGTSSSYLPVGGYNRSDSPYWPYGADPTPANMVSMQGWRVDYDYVQTLGMNIVQGRNFSKDFPSDSSAVILNETALKLFGFKDPIGQKISRFSGGSVDNLGTKTFTIVGIVKDFHFESLKENIAGLGLFLAPSTGDLSFRFAARDVQSVIATLQKTWKEMAPGEPFQYSFLDDDFGRMYQSEQKLGQIFGIFTCLAVLIACLGMFALTAFTAEQRTKEIGIRKVMGASVSGIIVLLSREFGKLVLISFCIATPLSWFAVQWWLKNYTYKVQIGPLTYLMAGVITLLIAWLTMSYQSFRAATANPIKSLRSE